jgi:hypothetical protein
MLQRCRRKADEMKTPDPGSPRGLPAGKDGDDQLPKEMQEAASEIRRSGCSGEPKALERAGWRLAFSARSTACLLGAYGFLGTLLFPFFRYALNIDTVSYISIAQKYLRADWSHAVNGFWGPLYSWLMIPLMAVGVDAAASALAASLGGGLVALLGVIRLSRQFEMSEEIRWSILWALIPVFLYFSVTYMTPDLLLLGILFLYFSILFDPDYIRGHYNGIFCGVLGGLAYFAKAYAFYFFLLHFTLLGFLHIRSAVPGKEKRAAVRQLLLGIIVFCFLSGVWASLISQKYGRITVGTAGAYNHARTNPASWGSFYLEGVIIPPPDGSAVSIMDDPERLPVPAWNPRESTTTLLYQSNVVVKSMYDIFLRSTRFFPLTAAVVMGYLLLGVSRRVWCPDKSGILFPLITIFTFPLGYTLFVVNDRYLWVLFILLILMGGHLLHLLASGSRFREAGVRRLALILFVLSFVVVPVKTILQDAPSYIGKADYDLSNQVGTHHRLTGRLLSDSEWAKSQKLACFLKCQYYGTAGKSLREEGIGDTLKKYEIDYVLLWESLEDIPPVLEGHEEMTGGEIPGLRIYRFTHRTITRKPEGGT